MVFCCLLVISKLQGVNDDSLDIFDVFNRNRSCGNDIVEAVRGVFETGIHGAYICLLRHFFLFFSLSLKRLDLGTAYAIWAGLGTALIALIGVLYFRDGMDMIKAVSLAAIIAGVIGLNLSGAQGSA